MKTKLALLFWILNFAAVYADDSQEKAKPPQSVVTLIVNGHRLRPSEEKWVRFVAKSVVPELRGTREQRIKLAADVTWWGLKEGIYNVANPLVFSSCSKVQTNGSNKNIRLNALQICETGKAWQVGLAAVQVPNFSEQKVLDTIKLLWPDREVSDVLKETLKMAGYNLADPTAKAILNSTGVLQKSWLLRHPVVGFTLIEGNVRGQCIESSHNYCYGTGWIETRAYAPTREAAMKSIADLKELFEKLAP